MASPPLPAAGQSLLQGAGRLEPRLHSPTPGGHPAADSQAPPVLLTPPPKASNTHRGGSRCPRGPRSASEPHMSNQDACSQPETSPWQIPELFHNLPSLQDSELVGTDSQHHGVSLTEPQWAEAVAAAWGRLLCQSLLCGSSNPRLQRPQETLGSQRPWTFGGNAPLPAGADSAPRGPREL